MAFDTTRLQNANITALSNIKIYNTLLSERLPFHHRFRTIVVDFRHRFTVIQSTCLKQADKGNTKIACLRQVLA